MNLSIADITSRARGAFYGLALGDALGMPTQSMSRSEIVQDYGAITRLVPAGPRQRIAAGMPAGAITDDTEQAVLLAELLVAGDGQIDPMVFATRLLEWERAMAAKGSLDLLGPSTKAAVQMLADGGSVAESGRFGSTNGAAMRITPVGIAHDSSDMSRFVDAVVEASAVTHNTTLGIGSAAAVGAAISAGVRGASQPETIEVAIAAATEGEKRGYWIAGGSIAQRTNWAVNYLKPLSRAEQINAVENVIGTSVASQESVVATLALAAVTTDPWQSLCQAAEVGGDTDTIAAMLGAILGARLGISAWPDTEIAILERVNSLKLNPLIDQLLHLRQN
ncbi:ADP-ribosylglycohydrolase family protein [Jonesiaceae bacterium BS-20]|uniref:ADP-ribosylglycohydrolase family protein n=1 Tax=Jonesiaceae bacterium BS-20 TaxID=3120821 RepID=A0AAU7DVD9_9MICO